MEICDPLTGEQLVRDPVTTRVGRVMMDTSMPKMTKSRATFDESEGEWEYEPSEDDEPHPEAPEYQAPEEGMEEKFIKEDTLKYRWSKEFDNTDGRDLGWRIDQEQEWWSHGAEGRDVNFGRYAPAKKFLGYKPGYVYKLDHLGVGYYRDNPGTIS